MPRKLTHDIIQNRIVDEGYELINIICEDEERIRSNVRIRIRCAKGHEYETAWNKFIGGSRCKQCYIDRKTYTQEYVTSYVESCGYQLLSNYLGSREYLTLLCPQGHTYRVTFDAFKNGAKRCKKCTRKYTYDEVKEHFEREGCVLLSDTYATVSDVLQFVCICGEVGEITYMSFLRGGRCKSCFAERRDAPRRVPYDDVHREFESLGLVLLTTREEYTGASKSLRYKCGCGNVSETTLHLIRKGVRCKECGIKRRTNTCLDKYGTKYSLGNVEIRNKGREALYVNGTGICSRQQMAVYNVIGGELNYHHNGALLDIAFPDEKIYVECDFGGHWLPIKMGTMTKKEFEDKQRKRSYALYRKGWKEIRIISRRDRLPLNINVLMDMMILSRKHFGDGHTYISFDIDNGSVQKSKDTYDYDYGKLRRVR